MESLWSEAEAGRAIARYREQGVAEVHYPNCYDDKGRLQHK